MKFAVLASAVLFGAAQVGAVDEASAIDLVAKAMRHLSPEQASTCLSYMVEEQSSRRFDIAVHEKHGGACPGDPAIAPVIERFRVMRLPLQLGRWDPVDDVYVDCEISAKGDPTCPPLR